METIQKNQVSTDLRPGIHRHHQRGVFGSPANGQARPAHHVSSVDGLPSNAVARRSQRRIMSVWYKHRITVCYLAVCMVSLIVIELIKEL